MQDQHKAMDAKGAETRDRTGDLQIFSLTKSQLSYRGHTTQSATCVQWIACVNFPGHICLAAAHAQ